IAMSEDVYISENIFSGNSSADGYFLSVATTLGLNVDYNRSSNTTNFIKSGDAGDTSNMKVTNNNAYTLGSGIEIVTSGLLSEVIMTGNSLLCPASSIGIYLEVTMDGAITNLNLRGNIIPLATNKIYVSPSATGWDTLTRNTRSQISVAYNGMQLFELSTNSNIQYLNNGWL
ncbi:phage tail protein, partial [Salmonella enterica]|nr:phage tail protein [Salmonella enterica]EFU2949842.1 phage tail protein [Salmonella enterica]EGX7446074.1 phage tail protein [Salmonella enterica]EHD4078959.1 phage tail protein [Salmonella enterica]EHD4656137.1 phage tail protein [Salmonella enterica]